VSLILWRINSSFADTQVQNFFPGAHDCTSLWVQT
jgi:hypothetical protein